MSAYIRPPNCPACSEPQGSIRLYSSEEAADFLGGAGRISRGTVGVWRRGGWIRSLKLGGVRGAHYYTRDALEECLSLKHYENRIQEEEDAK